MEIRHNSHSFSRDSHVRKAATDHGCTANVKWSDPFSVRFTLHPLNELGRPASSEQHDTVIRALLTQDPDATVRTARAVYEGFKDFESQVAARLTQA